MSWLRPRNEVPNEGAQNATRTRHNAHLFSRHAHKHDRSAGRLALGLAHDIQELDDVRAAGEVL
jgi:hypothetical protein